MALPFWDSGSRKRRDQILGVDLGGRVTKAVHLQRRGDTYTLNRFAFLDAPIFDKSISAEMLAEHLRAIGRAFDSKVKSLVLTMGVNDAVVRHVDLPPMPLEDMRMVLRNNSRVYLQQDMSGYVFDCHIVSRPSAPSPEAPKPGSSPQKQKVLIAGAKKQLVDDFIAGAKSAGFTPEFIVPGVIGPVNSFELAMPEVFAKECVALVDIGFRSSSISILQEGELILNRVVSIGGDRLTSGLAESMNISYAEAEGIKIGMAHEVQNILESVLTPLGRELRASIDFFEHQQDRPVAQILLSGGSAKSEFIVENLRRELMAECNTWSPAGFLKMALPADQSAEVDHVAPQLTVAIGAALTAL